MAWIDVIPETAADGDLADVYADIMDSRGKMSNVLRVHSLNPAALREHTDLYMAIMYGRSKLRRLERELVATVVSLENKCPYCIHHHAEALNQYWKDDDRVARLLEDVSDAELSAREIVMVRHAVKLTNKADDAEEEDIEALREVGLSDREILDLTLVVAYFNFVNRIVLGLGVEFSPDELTGYSY